MRPQCHNVLVSTCCTREGHPIPPTTITKKLQYHRPNHLVFDGILLSGTITNKLFAYKFQKSSPCSTLFALWDISKWREHWRVHQSYHWNGSRHKKFCNECHVYMGKWNFPKETNIQLIKLILITKPSARVGLDVLRPFQTTINECHLIAMAIWLLHQMRFRHRHEKTMS